MGNLPAFVVASCCLLCHAVYSQDQPVPLDKADKIITLPSRYIEKVQEKFLNLDKQLARQTEKYLKRLAKQEEKLNSKLSKYDSKVAQHVNDGQKFYGELANKINAKVNIDKPGVSGGYIPYVDSVQTSLAFLEQNNQLLSQSKDIQQKLQGSLAEVKQFQSKLQQTERIKEYIKQRKQQMKDMLSRYSNLPGNITKVYSGYTKQLYYYSAQIKEYRDIANDPDKITKKALSLLSQSKAFQQFAQKYSQLAGLFSLPANYGNVQSLAGLQTRAQVQGLIQTQLAAAGPNATQMLQQNLQAAQAQLNQFKDKIKKFGNGTADMDMPDFKPKNLKTKSFWRRLEYGTNLQTSKSTYFIPTETDVGLSIGYKLSEKSSFGVGMAYKVGLGKDIQHISLTGQGVDLRSYMDVKIKSSFYASAGFEYNYIKPFQDYRRLYDFDKWQRSALIGVSKIVSLKGRWAKKTKLQLLWDMLYTRQVPRVGQPIKFRLGYAF